MPYQLQITLASDLAEFAVTYAKEHNITVQEALREGLRMLVIEEQKKNTKT